MSAHVVYRDPDQGYLSDMLWLPKHRINRFSVKSATSAYLPSGELLTSHYETERHIVIPREYNIEVPFPVHNLNPRAWEEVDWRCSARSRNTSEVAVWGRLVDHHSGVLNLACGKGKALAHDEPVATENGFVSIQDLEVGDLVYGSDGRLHPITGVYPQGQRDLYRLHFTDGTHVDCDIDHLWTFQKKRSTGQAYVTISVRELLGTPLRNKGGRIFYLPTIKPIVYPHTEETPLDPYTLGVILGDGGLTQNVILTTADEDILDLLVLPDGNHIKKLRHGKSGKSHSYLLGNTRRSAQDDTKPSIKKILADLGVMGKKSKEKFIPQQFLYGSVEQRLGLLQGLFDTDGTPTPSAAVEFTTASERMCLGVQQLVYSLGGTATVRKRENFYTKNSERFGPFVNYRLLVKLPASMEPFRLQRHKDRYTPDQRQREPYRALDRIESIGVGEATCISVASEDSLFLTRNFTPTHNTVLGLRKIAKERGPAIIVVHTTQLMGQWMERICQFMQIGRQPCLPSDIGVVRGSRAEWDRPIVLAMIQTLYKAQVPARIRKRFKVMIFDEAHHLSAPKWLGTARFGFGMRFGLTATPENTLGTHELYYQHLGPIFHSDLEQEIIPTCWFMSIPGGHDMNDPNILDCTGALSLGRLYGVLGQKESRNALIRQELNAALSRGRKILALSQSRDHCELLHEQYEGSGLCIGPVPYETRLEYLATRQVNFGTMPVAVEGLDQPDLDMVVALTPFKSKTWLQQILGRIQRPQGKPPIALFILDRDIPVCVNHCQELMAQLHNWGYPVRVIAR